MMARLLLGDALTILATLPAASVRCCVTSPPYWGLRDYGVVGQLGLERTPAEYVERMVEVFGEVRRVLTDDGTLWLNLGDSYATSGGAGYQGKNGQRADRRFTQESLKGRPTAGEMIKPKDLIGIPWRVAFALQADGWYLRSDIIWQKPNPMPESVTDRPTKSHEYLFLLSKAERYYYDADAISDPAIHAGRVLDYTTDQKANGAHPEMQRTLPRGRLIEVKATRNARTVWTIGTQPYPEAHFATFPDELPRRCILAGSAPRDTVLDPFSGSGTTAAVAVGNGRQAIGIELNPAYLELARQRVGPMLVVA